MRKNKSKKIRKVAIVLRLVGAAGRDLLTGISTYARDFCHWQISVFNSSEQFTPAVVNRLKDEGYDGIITSEPGTSGTLASLEKSTIPLAIIGWKGEWMPKRTTNIAFIRNDDESIGYHVAERFLSRGKFRSFAFITTPQRFYWSLLREKGFRAALRRHRIETIVFKTPYLPNDLIDERCTGEFLKQLPKPTAIMVALDELAVRILEICRNVGIDVPRQAAVIGTDNDTLLCDFAEPPLSSAAPNHIREGEIVAAALEHIMRTADHRKTEVINLICREHTIVERESSQSPAPSAHLIERALRFISENVRTNLKVDDVVRHLGVSKRLANLRFRECGETTITESISAARMDEVAKLLRRTKQSIGQIAEQCSFNNLQHLANAFRRRFGMTMSAYRQLSPAAARRAVPHNRKRSK